MKKILIWLLLISSFFSIVACDSNSGQNGQTNNVPKTNYVRYISEFENYADCNICYTNVQGRRKINEDKAYVTQGANSLEVHSYDKSCITTILADNGTTQVTDLSEAKYISLDVYNANEFSLDFNLTVTADGGRTFLLVDKVCPPNSWTEVSGVFDSARVNKMDCSAYSYVFSASNRFGVEFDMYFDDFYIEFDRNVLTEYSAKIFAQNEIQNFETMDDILCGDFFSGDRIGVKYSLNTDDYYAKSGYSLRLDIKEKISPTFTEIWNYTQYLYFGVRFNKEYISQVHLSENTAAISMWVYNTNVTRKKGYIKVYDTYGYSSEVSVWCYPETWTQVRLENFGQVDICSVNQLEIYFEGLHTFNEYSLFIDSLQIEEA